MAGNVVNINSYSSVKSGRNLTKSKETGYNNLYLLLVIVILCISLISCVNKTDITDKKVSLADSLNLELIFHSGFEPGSGIIKPANHKYYIQGIDSSFNTHNDWIENLDNYPKIGRFLIEVKEGTEDDRYAAIVDDPKQPSNKVLKFWLKHPHELIDANRKKGRVQGIIRQNSGLTEVYQKINLLLSDDFNILKTFPDSFSWLTIFEMWNDNSWGGSIDSEYPFRVTLGIRKVDEGVVDSLFFMLKGQTRDDSGSEDIWKETNMNFSLPIDEWFTLEVYMKEGDRNSGRFVVTATLHGVHQVLFDITNYTFHPDDPVFDDGFPSFNPMKLYTSEDLVNFVDKNGGALQIFWDDFELYGNK